MNRIKQALNHFYEEVGAKYPEEEEVYGTLRGRMRKQFILSFLDSWNGSLLDIGCNRGMYLQAYHGGPRVGIDISLQVLLKARRNPDIQYAVADAESLQCFRPGQFDHVLCSEVLEHCLNPGAVFSSIHLVLKQNGQALITTPNYRRHRPRWIDTGPLSYYGIENPIEKGYLHTAFRPEELKQLAEKAGFQVIESGTLEKEVKYAAKIPVLFRLAGRLLNRVFRSEKLDHFNERLFNRMSLWIYAVCHATRLEKLLIPFFREGVRSYIVIQK
jgi:2-polyprenyl-3-methyl-5-hydroxy-6-metoxy-1,4-benzoquinol methylase